MGEREKGTAPAPAGWREVGSVRSGVLHRVKSPLPQSKLLSRRGAFVSVPSFEWTPVRRNRRCIARGQGPQPSAATIARASCDTHRRCSLG